MKGRWVRKGDFFATKVYTWIKHKRTSKDTFSPWGLAGDMSAYHLKNICSQLSATRRDRNAALDALIPLFSKNGICAVPANLFEARKDPYFDFLKATIRVKNSRTPPEQGSGYQHCWRNVQFCYLETSPINSIDVICHKKFSYKAVVRGELRLYIYEQYTQASLTVSEAIATIYSGAHKELVSFEPCSHYSFPFNTHQDYFLVSSLLKLINRKLDRTIFSPEIFNDLELMLGRITLDNTLYKENFSTPTLPPHFTHQTPKYTKNKNKNFKMAAKNTSRLFDILYQNIEWLDGSHSALLPLSTEKEFESVLISKVDVNLPDNNGMIPLFLALWENRGERIISLLLRYGADPFDRGHNDYVHMSPFELAAQSKGAFPTLYSTMIKAMVSSTFRPPKALPSTVALSAIMRHEHAIYSEFKFQNGEIFKSEIKPTKYLTFEEAAYYVEFAKRYCEMKK